MTEETVPSRVLEHEVGDQDRGDDDGKRHPEAAGPRHHETDDIREDVAESDPGSGPEETAGRSVKDESIEANGNHPSESGGEWVQTRQKLCQDDIPHAMRDEPLLGVPDEGVRVQGEPAQGPEHSGSMGPAQGVPEDV